MRTRNLKTKDMPLQDGHHRALAQTESSNLGQEVNSTDILSEGELSDSSTKGSVGPPKVDAVHGKENFTCSLSLSETLSAHSPLDTILKKACLSVTPLHLKFIESLLKYAPWQAESGIRPSLWKMVEQLPDLQHEVAVMFAPGLPLILLPTMIRKRIAVFAINSGTWEIVATCKTLHKELGSLVSQHGICRINIGSPKIIEPKLLRTDCLNKIMNIEIIVLRTGDPFNSTMLDTNMNLLSLFKKNDTPRKRFTLTLVGLQGHKWAFEKGFLTQMPPISTFEQFVLNIRCIHPGVDERSLKTDWRKNMYNASYNDMIIATTPLTILFGPCNIFDDGAVFRPQEYLRRAIIKACASSSPYSNDERLFSFNQNQTNPDGRILYHDKNKTTKQKLQAWLPTVTNNRAPTQEFTSTGEGACCKTHIPACLVAEGTAKPQGAGVPVCAQQGHSQLNRPRRALSVKPNVQHTPARIASSSRKYPMHSSRHDDPLTDQTTNSATACQHRLAAHYSVSQQDGADALLALAASSTTDASQKIVGSQKPGLASGPYPKVREGVELGPAESKQDRPKQLLAPKIKHIEYVDLTSPTNTTLHLPAPQNLKKNLRSVSQPSKPAQPFQEQHLQPPRPAPAKRSSAPPIDRQQLSFPGQAELSDIRHASVPPSLAKTNVNSLQSRKRTSQFPLPESRRDRGVHPTDKMRRRLLPRPDAAVLADDEDIVKDGGAKPLDHQGR